MMIDSSLEGERKQVTIIFADISGFTALNDAAKTPSEVESVVRLINLLLQTLSEAIYEFDGYIDKYIGDEIMAVFGAPKAHEDDPERALRAVLSMQERLEEFNRNPPMPLPEELGIHGGISTGTVIAGYFGTERTRSYTVMGDAVNVAARLEGVSERGEFLISESTYNLTRHLFEFDEREPVQVKGKREPLKIYQLLGLGKTGPPKPPEAPIVGREYELDILVKQYDNLQEEKGGVVVVTGEAGLGKSRLVSEFRKYISKDTLTKTTPLWLFGQSLSYRQSFKNRLFVDILYSYLDLPENPDDTLVKLRLEAMGEKLFGARQNEVVPFLATLLGVALDEAQKTDLPLNDPQILQQRTFVAMGEWVEALVTQQPVVMVFEDLHWADPSSVELIEYLFSLTLYKPLSILCVTRPDRDSTFWEVKTRSSQDYDNFTELTLWPLTDSESRQVIQYQLKIDHMPEEIEHLILSRAEGNPLFLEEILRSLIEEGSIVHTADGHWQITRSATEIDIPNTLQGVLIARIDRLSPEVKEILQVAAVIDRRFPRYILKPMANKSDEVLNDALEQLKAADLIEVVKHESEPEYQFKHVLTHEIVYNGQLYQQRKAMHKKIADYMAFNVFWMLGEEYAPVVAEHYYKSETWPRAMRYLQRAADAAIQSFANQEAINFYTQALEVADRIGDEADQAAIMTIYEGRAKIRTRLGEPQGAIADYEAMLAKAKELKDDAAQMRALNGLGSLQANHYDFSMASIFFRDALEVARRIGDETGIADTLNQLGNFHLQMGQLHEGVKAYEEARQISINLKDEARRIEAEDGLAKIMLEEGEIAASLERYEQEIIHVRRRLGFRTGLMSSLNTVVVTQTFLGDYEKAREAAQEALELYKKSGDAYQIPIIKYYLAFGQMYQGEMGAAAEVLSEGLRLANEQKQKSSQILGLIWQSYYNLNLGRTEDGLKQAQQALDIAQGLGSPLYELRAEYMLGTAYRHLKRSEEAIDILNQVQKTAHKFGLAIDEVLILYQLARGYVDSNQLDKATETTERLITLTRASDIKEFTIRGLWVRSLIYINREQYDTALETLIEASDMAETTDSRLSQYLIQIQKAYVYHKAGNDAASRDAISYAQKLQKRLVDSMTDETLRTNFLNNRHARHMQEMVEANSFSQVSAEVQAAGEGGR